jgi:uncharacterized protein
MDTSTVRGRLRQALGEALKARDPTAASALRSGLGALDNASAVPAALARPVPVRGASSPHFAGATAGLGAGETARKVLTEDDAEAIVRAEVAERQAAAGDYDRAGQPERADRLRREAGILARAVAAET